MKGDDKMIKWSKNYLMGIDKLDEEHKELFRISDQIYNKVMERGDDAKYRLYSGSVVKTKIQAFYNEPISVAELGRCPR